MLDLQDLLAFRTVTREGGITRASEKLGRVQSSITARIQKLEADLGRELFLREGRTMHISAAGRQLLTYADRLIALAEEAEAAMRDPTPRGELRLGAMDSTAAVRLPNYIALFYEKFPQATLKLGTSNPTELCARVLSGVLDTALVAGDIAEDRFDSVPVFDERLVLVAKAPIDISALPGSVIVFENGCPHRKKLEAVYASHGVAPAETTQIGSYHAMFASVLAGMGIALMPESTYRTLPDADRAVATPLPEGYNRLVTRMIWRKGSATPLIDAFRSVLPQLSDPCSPSPPPSSS